MLVLVAVRSLDPITIEAHWEPLLTNLGFVNRTMGLVWADLSPFVWGDLLFFYLSVS